MHFGPIRWMSEDSGNIGKHSHTQTNKDRSSHTHRSERHKPSHTHTEKL